MTIVVRIAQTLLILAGLAACVTAVVLAGMAHDDVSGRCYMIEVQGSTDRVPHPGCGTVSVFQTEAISAAAVGLAGIGVMIGAVALNGMASPSGPKPPKPAPYAYGPPPFPPQGPPTGPQPQYGPTA